MGKNDPYYQIRPQKKNLVADFERTIPSTSRQKKHIFWLNNSNYFLYDFFFIYKEKEGYSAVEIIRLDSSILAALKFVESDPFTEQENKKKRYF